MTENIQHCQCSFPCHRKERRSVLSGVQQTKQQIDFFALLVHLSNGIRRNIQRITGKSAGRKCFVLIYDRILPKIQCHQFLIHARPPVPVFSFLSLYHVNVKESTSPGKLSCFLKWGCPPISLFLEKSGITIVERAKHLPITAGAFVLSEYYERRVFYDDL